MKRAIWMMAAIVLWAGSAFGAETMFAPKAGDVWVMVGDSITAQRLHSNYIEAFYRTRYPELNLKFRNSGIGGDTTARVLARFDFDVVPFNPTVVSIELGMNDVNRGDDPTTYINEMRQILKRVRDIGARPVLISSSPVNDGSLMDAWSSDKCRRIHLFTEALKKLGQEEGAPVIDQYHPLLAIWGKNKSAEELAAMAQRLPLLTRDPNLPGVKELKDFEKAWKSAGLKPVVLGGDTIHPGPVGQYMMAAAILSGLGVPPEVSSATLKADGTVVAQEHCRISDAKTENRVLTFTRLDERGPWPIASSCFSAANLMPQIVELSPYMLRITDLPEGTYEVSADDGLIGKVTARQLAAGWNMSAEPTGALVARSERILALIGQLQGPVNNSFRAAAKAGDADRLAAAEKTMADHEAKLAAACKPQAMKFTVKPAKQ